MWVGEYMETRSRKLKNSEITARARCAAGELPSSAKPPPAALEEPVVSPGRGCTGAGTRSPCAWCCTAISASDTCCSSPLYVDTACRVPRVSWRHAQARTKQAQHAMPRRSRAARPASCSGTHLLKAHLADGGDAEALGRTRARLALLLLPLLVVLLLLLLGPSGRAKLCRLSACKQQAAWHWSWLPFSFSQAATMQALRRSSTAPGSPAHLAARAAPAAARCRIPPHPRWSPACRCQCSAPAPRQPGQTGPGAFTFWQMRRGIPEPPAAARRCARLPTPASSFGNRTPPRTCSACCSPPMCSSRRLTTLSSTPLMERRLALSALSASTWQRRQRVGGNIRVLVTVPPGL